MTKLSYVRLRVWILRIMHLVSGLFLYGILNFANSIDYLQVFLIGVFFLASFFGLIRSRCESCQNVWYRENEQEDLRWNKMGLARLARLMFSIPKKKCSMCEVERF